MSNNPKIPAWQRATTDSTTSSSSPTVDKPASTEEQFVQAPTPTEDDLPDTNGEELTEEAAEKGEDQGSDLLEQAQRFLEDPVIRDAPRQRKAAFLESKGVTPENIEALLGVTTQEDDFAALEDAGDRAWSTVSCTSLIQTPA